MSAPGASDRLRAATAVRWDAAVGHRFVAELRAGTVDDAVIARYLAQDLQFVDAFVALMGAGVAAADRPAPRLVLARQLGLVAGDEDDYFVRALRRLGVTGSQRSTPAAATRDFVELMDAARRSADYGVVLAVLLVAEWLYLDWADRPGPVPSDWLHREWVDLHRGDAFAAWVAFLREEFDRVADAAPDPGPLDRAFTRAVDLELAFFDAAYG